MSWLSQWPDDLGWHPCWKVLSDGYGGSQNGRAGHLSLGRQAESILPVYTLQIYGSCPSSLSLLSKQTTWASASHSVLLIYVSMDHVGFLFKCRFWFTRTWVEPKRKSISNRLQRMASYLSGSHWVARLCQMTRKPSSTVCQFLYLSGLESQSLSLAKCTNSPKGTFILKKKGGGEEEKDFNLQKPPPKENASPKGQPFLFFTSKNPQVSFSGSLCWVFTFQRWFLEKSNPVKRSGRYLEAWRNIFPK